jgi:hypothetical protein
MTPGGIKPLSPMFSPLTCRVQPPFERFSFKIVSFNDK